MEVSQPARNRWSRRCGEISRPGTSFVASCLACAALHAACADANGQVDAAPLADGGPAPNDASAALRELSLVDQAAWRYAELTSDPLLDHQPESVRCGLAGFYVERGELELDTGSCNYLYLEQPALRGVARGDELHLVLRHFDLTAPELAQAHVAILFEDAVEWETTIDVPGGADAHEVRWKSAHALAQGAPLRLHLHNHGQNTWTLSALLVAPP